MSTINDIIKRIMMISPKLYLDMRLYKLELTGRKEKEINMLNFLVTRGCCAVDIGANNGVYTHALLRLTDRVVAIEPNPQCVKELRRLFGQRIMLVEAALSDSQGLTELAVPRREAGQSYLGTIERRNPVMAGDAERITVPMMRLDDLSLEDVGFIKIDVEGHEESVVIGSEKTIQRYRPILLIEAEDRHKPKAVERLTARLEKLEYAGFFIENGALKSIKYFNPDIHQPESAVAEISHGNNTSLPYHNNFIFIPL